MVDIGLHAWCGSAQKISTYWPIEENTFLKKFDISFIVSNCEAYYKYKFFIFFNHFIIVFNFTKNKTFFIW